MSNVFFISDTHFCHKNIIKFEPYYRPFLTVEEHDEKLIENWNTVVRKGDIVYHLGDVIFSKEKLHYLGFLNGDKRLIMGNHDNYTTHDYLRYFTKLHGCLQWQAFCILSHIPVNEQQLQGRFRYNIHGHLHSKNVMLSVMETQIQQRNYNLHMPMKDKRYINVSCEQINNTPIEWEELKKRLIE